MQYLCDCSPKLLHLHYEKWPKFVHSITMKLALTSEHIKNKHLKYSKEHIEYFPLKCITNCHHPLLQRTQWNIHWDGQIIEIVLSNGIP